MPTSCTAFISVQFRDSDPILYPNSKCPIQDCAAFQYFNSKKRLNLHCCLFVPCLAVSRLAFSCPVVALLLPFCLICPLSTAMLSAPFHLPPCCLPPHRLPSHSPAVRLPASSPAVDNPAVCRPAIYCPAFHHTDVCHSISRPPFCHSPIHSPTVCCPTTRYWAHQPTICWPAFCCLTFCVLAVNCLSSALLLACCLTALLLNHLVARPQPPCLPP